MDVTESRGGMAPTPPKEQAMNILTQRLPGLPVGLLRMMFGILWLQAALQKAPWVINAQGQRFGWLSNWLWTETQHPTFGFSKAMLEHVVLPHFTFFGSLSFVVELALGVSLLFGLLTVLSGIGGALWQCNIAIGSYAVPGEWGWIWPLLIAPHLVFAFSHAGRSVGVDLFLYHWLSKDPTGQTGIGRFLCYWA